MIRETFLRFEKYYFLRGGGLYVAISTVLNAGRRREPSLVAGIDTRTVGDIASIHGGFPPFHTPLAPFTWEEVNVVEDPHYRFVIALL